MWNMDLNSPCWSISSWMFMVVLDCESKMLKQTGRIRPEDEYYSIDPNSRDPGPRRKLWCSGSVTWFQGWLYVLKKNRVVMLLSSFFNFHLITSWNRNANQRESGNSILLCSCSYSDCLFLFRTTKQKSETICRNNRNNRNNFLLHYQPISCEVVISFSNIHVAAKYCHRACLQIPNWAIVVFFFKQENLIQYWKPDNCTANVSRDLG